MRLKKVRLENGFKCWKLLLRLKWTFRGSLTFFGAFPEDLEWSRTGLNPFRSQAELDPHSLVHHHPAGNFISPQTDTTEWEHFTNTASHKQKIKITTSFQHPNGPNLRVKKKDKRQVSSKSKLKSQLYIFMYFYIAEFIFSGGGGGAHSWHLIEQEIPGIPSPHYCPGCSGAVATSLILWHLNQHKMTKSGFSWPQPQKTFQWLNAKDSPSLLRAVSNKI